MKQEVTKAEVINMDSDPVKFSKLLFRENKSEKKCIT